jgi:thymidylate synthase (FAD)
LKEVEPRYHIFADPNDTGELEVFLKNRNIDWYPDPNVSFIENLHEFAGRLCYESWSINGEYENLNITKTRSGNKKYLNNILNVGHESVIEHGGPLVILFENVSRLFTHELVRHRLNSYSQTSGRYVRTNDVKFWIPPDIAENPEAVKLYKDVIEYLEKKQKELNDIFDIENINDFHTKKVLSSSFRRLLPNGLANNILVSCNHRAMRHMILMRTSEGAEIEMQVVFRRLAHDMKERFPNIYQDIVQNDLGEFVKQKAE